MQRLLGRRARLALIVLAALLVAALALRLAPKPPLSSYAGSSVAVYDTQGKLLRLTTSPDEKYRLWVGLEQISPVLVEAILLHEDRHFYLHPGVNPASLVRGAWKTYVAGGRRQGGSTVTMQLARLLYRINTRTPTGKLEQSLRAAQLELLHSKREILEAYLNLVPFSNNIEGVAAASLIYFGKRSDQLTLPEALTLAVIPQSPVRRAPAQTAQPLQDARARLYQAWLAQHPVPAPTDYMALPLKLRTTDRLPFHAPHLVDMLLAENRSGSQIRSTLDLGLQRTLERHVARYVRQQRRVGIDNAAAMLVNYRTMEVKAVAGSVDFFDRRIEGQVNGTQAKRSPGSTLKPFIYALAMDQGLLHPMTVLKDAPTAFGPFSPENFDGRFLGPITARDALIRSRNVPAVSVAARLSSPSFYEFLRSAGISRLAPEQHYGLALVLGGGEVSMEELAMLYAALGNRGVLRPLRYRQSDPMPAGIRVLSEEASFMTLDMLKANPRPDQAFAAQPGALRVYWKTGTSWGFRDAWTVGIFGPYVLAVWIGNFNGESNPAFVGIQAAAPLFFEIADSIRAQEPDLYEPAHRAPPNLARVEVCAASGDLPNTYCPARTQTWFIPGKSPIRMSDVHRAVIIDNRTGQQACPPYDRAGVHVEVYEFWPSDMLRLFQQAGMPRRVPPPAPENCTSASWGGGSAPRILSPLRGTTYTLRTRSLASETIALQASADADAEQVFWFVNDRFIARAKSGSTYLWAPGAPGSYVVRAVDGRGRSDARDLTIAVVQ